MFEDGEMGRVTHELQHAVEGGGRMRSQCSGSASRPGSTPVREQRVSHGRVSPKGTESVWWWTGGVHAMRSVEVFG